VNASGTICDHIRAFYPQRFPEPIVFWEFDSEQSLPSHATLVQKDSESGDSCHYNIQGISINESKRIIYAVPVNNCSVCDNGIIRQLTLEDLPS
jgi:hypothetical protein